MVSRIQFFFLLFCIGCSGRSYSADSNGSILRVKEEKLSHIHFYFHDRPSGANPTSVVAVPPISDSSSTVFGFVGVMDNILTEGPDPSSPLVGFAQGVQVAADQQELGIFLSMNLAFTSGDSNGSIISITGRDRVFTEPTRELSIIGGTRKYRFARGYATIQTHSFDITTNITIEEYDLYVLHY